VGHQLWHLQLNKWRLCLGQNDPQDCNTLVDKVRLWAIININWKLTFWQDPFTKKSVYLFQSSSQDTVVFSSYISFAFWFILFTVNNLFRFMFPPFLRAEWKYDYKFIWKASCLHSSLCNSLVLHFSLQNGSLQSRHLKSVKCCSLRLERQVRQMGMLSGITAAARSRMTTSPGLISREATRIRPTPFSFSTLIFA